MKKQFIALSSILILATATLVSCGGGDKKADKKEEVKTDVYTCPMKCNNGQTYDKPGKCPECGMELEKVTKS